MPKRSVLRRGLVLFPLLGCVVFGYLAVAASEKEPADGELEVLWPPEHVALLSGNFDVIVKVPRPEPADPLPLELNGQPQPWDAHFTGAVRVAHLRLSPGVYELKIGDRRIDFAVALNEEEHDGPRDWPTYRNHTTPVTADRCAGCHEDSTEGGEARVGKAKPYKACFECHHAVEFQVIHSHPVQPLENCDMCHSMHGSANKRLLRGPVKKLCAACHDT